MSTLKLHKYDNLLPTYKNYKLTYTLKGSFGSEVRVILKVTLDLQQDKI